MHRWDELVESCLREDAVRGLSSATIEARRYELSRCGQWLSRRRPKPVLETVDGQLLIGYLRSRSKFKSKSTVSGAVTILRHMGEHLVARGVWSKNPMRWIRGPKIDFRSRLPRTIRRSDLAALWNAAQAIRSPRRREKWRAVLALLYATGIRRGQLSALDVEDVDIAGGLVLIRGVKGGRDNAVPIAQEVCACLASYLLERKKVLDSKGLGDATPLFITPDGRRQPGERLSAGIKRIVRCAGLGRITLHQFRHTCASDLLASGIHLPEVQRILGHAEIGSTMWYLSVSDESRKQAIAQHPINTILEATA